MTRPVQRFVTLCRADLITACRVTDFWPDQRPRWERIRWARIHAGYERAKDAADSLGIKPGTYRTYERGPEDGGREPPLTELQRLARKFKVNWIWLATGEGETEDDILRDERLAAAARKAAAIDPDRADDAWTAVMGVLDAFARKAG